MRYFVVFCKMNWTVLIGILTFSTALYAQVMMNLTPSIPKGTFSCEGRTSGYYADVGSGCQVYHMCDGLGRQFSYTCPNATLFQQRMLICDHWYMVNCSKSEEDYSANLLIGQREKPFVDDRDINPYYRTPRPDLLSHPTASEANIIYRTGRTSPSHNIVGAESQNESTSTDEPTYFLPSHWSTEYTKDNTTPNPNRNKAQYKPNQSSFVRTSYDTSTKKIATKAKGKSIEVNVNNRNNVNGGGAGKSNASTTQTQFPVNFKSNFKATTPVYPTTVDVTSESAEEAGLLPPIPYASKGKTEDVKETTKYEQINYKSNFKATTPVYPTSVDATSPNPDEVGLLPPQEKGKKGQNVPSLNLDFEPPQFDDSYLKENRTIVPEKPSKFYQPPRFEPDYTQPLTEKPKIKDNLIKTVDIFKSMNSDQWNQLRKSFLIPDYDFPLDAATRPSYDSDFSSFQAKSVKK